MAQRPVIGICTAQERAKWSVWDQEAVLLPRHYVRAVQRAGGFAVLLSPDPELAEDPAQALGLLDGLLLAGGADINPGTYGAESHPETEAAPPGRDEFEVAMARGAIDLDLPLLGICRGMQLINVACGGTLLQHVPELNGHSEHRRVPGTFDGAEHDVDVVPGSLMANVVGEECHVAKSHHHQGVDRVGEGLVVSATATIDGLPEAIEMPERSFVLGVQWHPEVDPDSPVVGAFVREAAHRTTTLQPQTRS
jgi:putative glutamine amidotransferase